MSVIYSFLYVLHMPEQTTEMLYVRLELGGCAFSHAPAEWRETFAEAQVPYDKILGCAKFGAVWAASRREKSGDAVRWNY